jgi:hypothetical protein
MLRNNYVIFQNIASSSTKKIENKHGKDELAMKTLWVRFRGHGVEHHFQQYFSYIVEVRFIGVL